MPVYKKHHNGIIVQAWLFIKNRLFKQKTQTSKKRRFKIVAGGFLLITIIITLVIYHLWEIPLVSPLTQSSWLTFSSPEKLIFSTFINDEKTRVVYGFLPYWNINTVKIQPELTHLSYFGLNVQEDGTIATEDADGNTHPGYRNLDSDRLLELANQVYDEDSQFEITLVQFDADNIVKIANDTKAHENLLQSIDAILLSNPVSGINIDIEYGGTITRELRDNFASLIEKIDQHLDKKYDQVTLSIDMYASASNNEQIWDVPRIANAVDYVVVMAYDFHRRGSSQAGPVAPLFGGKEKWDTDIHQHLREYLRYVPREKLLLGIPFYGYGWQTDSHSPQANAFPDTGFTATYTFVQDLINNPEAHQVLTGWDDQALCPYLSYEEDEEIFMIYYEDVTSISYKLEYVKQLDLAGIAIWALGYEGEQRDLWEPISKL